MEDLGGGATERPSPHWDDYVLYATQIVQVTKLAKTDSVTFTTNVWSYCMSVSISYVLVRVLDLRV